MPSEDKLLRPRTAFKHFMNYLNSEVLDFDKIERDGMMETYYKAMEFVGEAAGNSAYSPFYKEDGVLMLAIETQTKSMDELCETLEVSSRSMAPRMNKLVNYGYVSSLKEKKVTYYKLTPYGRKYLEELINNPESVLYD